LFGYDGARIVTTAAGRVIKSTTAAPNPGLWWLSPAVIPLVIGAASIIPTALVGDVEFRSLWRTPKAITPDTLMLFGFGAISLAFGALIGSALAPLPRLSLSPWPDLGEDAIRVLRRASTFLTAATLAGYVGFLYLIARSGLTLLQLFGGSEANGNASAKESIGTIPGLTTLTELGIGAVVVSTIILVQQFSRFELVKLLIVIGLAVPRAYIFAERLAILELILPVTVVLAAKLSIGGRVRRVIARALPLGGIAMVVVVFGLFEYSRSWSFYRAHGETSFVGFALSRLAGYYVTALNNGQLILSHLDWQGRWPYDTMAGFWNAPGIEKIGLYERLGGHPVPYSLTGRSPYADVLDQFGNNEFNNPSGFVGPFVDYGRFGGLIWLVLAGVAAGLLYQQFCSARFLGLLLYPFFFVGLAEFPRYLYWVQGRTMYTWIALLVIVVLLARDRGGRHRKAGERTLVPVGMDGQS
jgi:oligosaccharide repeat unit polymerase